MIFYTLEALQGLIDLPPVLVIGHGAEAVQQAVQSAGFVVQFALQAEQLGTGHAVSCARELLAGQAERILVTCADMPLLQAETLRSLIALHEQSGEVMTMTSVIGEVSRGFGRVLRDAQGGVRAIVEEAGRHPRTAGHPGV